MAINEKMRLTQKDGQRRFLGLLLFIMIFLFSLVSSVILGVPPVSADECDGCITEEGRCYDYGIRVDSEYCSLDGTFRDQKPEVSACDNNFECDSNACIESRCVSAGLLRRIWLWITETFL